MMISLQEMAARLQCKWQRTLLMGALARRRTGFTAHPPEAFESRVLLAANPVGSPVQIDADDSNGVSSGDVDRIADGRAVAVWREDIDGAALVLAQRFDSAGATVGDVIEVTDDFASDSIPAVAMSNDGAFVVVWVSDETFIVGRQFQADGTPVDDEFDIGEAAGEAQSIIVDVDMDADGDFVVVWAAGLKRATAVVYSGYDDSAVFGRRYMKTGAPVEIEFRVDAPTNDDAYLVANPRVAVDADGDFAIGWTGVGENYVHKVVTYHYSGETYTYEYDVLTLTDVKAIVRRYDGNNFQQPAVASAPQVILAATKPDSVVNLQALAMDSDGDLLVVMTRDQYFKSSVRYSGETYEYLEIKSSELLVKRLSQAPAKGKAKRLIKLNKTAQISGAAAVLDEDGDFTIAYKQNAPPVLSVSDYAAPLPAHSRKSSDSKARNKHAGRDLGKEGEIETNDRLLIQNFDLKSKKVGDPAQLVNTAAGNLTSFAMAGTGTGELSVIWSLGTAGTDGKLFGRRVQT